VVTVHVPLTERRDDSYDILIGRGLVDDLGTLLAERCRAAAYAVIADSHVASVYGERVVAAAQRTGSAVHLLTFPAGEWNKTRETWGALSDRLLDLPLGRDAAVVALGGGVSGDLAGFTAATYLRGLPWVQVPTTLLAMIDASIGGKTGVDTRHGKNLLGAFHQPRLVVADLDTLSTLSAPHIAAGMAEALKHGVIADAEYFDGLVRSHGAIRARDGATLEGAVSRSVEIKAAIVAADARERGPRAALNFGHTIGHALEAVSAYALLHGEAVAIGMAYEGRLAERQGIAAPGTAQRITAALARFGLPLDLPEGVSVEALIDTMRVDKKSRGGEIRLALPARVGAMAGDETHGWTAAVSVAALREVLAGPAGRQP
jgi:3-dehydroquinate synthase